MQITVNGQPERFEAPARTAPTVAALLDAHGLAQQPVAVEVNQQLVPKRDHAQTTLKEGDTVELVTLVGGG